MFDTRQLSKTNDFAPHRRPASDVEFDGVFRGLSADVPHISPRWFYDDVGSALFEAITRLPEYYPTRCELEILDAHGKQIGERLGQRTAVIELGSGSAQKIGRLLPHLASVRAYRPIDVSNAALQATSLELVGRFPQLRVDPVHADFSDRDAMHTFLQRAAGTDDAVLFFPGSTLGNFEVDYAAALLEGYAQGLRPGTPLLLGVDLVKPRETLEAAYDDPAGVTAAFNRNMLAHLNRRFNGNFDLAQWRHEARWVPRHRRIEMWLRCDEPQVVQFGEQRIEFAAGAGIHTENSHKWDRPSLHDLAETTGWSLQDWWTDRRGWFAQALLVRQDDQHKADRLTATNTGEHRPN
ncbi:MAG: L-histidine N(alpha)-methyltransferase [Myxococcales bacterium FL481]|nr:MAG: L-histidine N(alpha)-methyltransferase [Myxococcales bacterium FL481]